MTDDLVCSAKGCRAAATRALVWANPRIHTGGRTKTWLACETHVPTLSTFLGERRFLREVVPVEDLEDGRTDGPGTASA